MCDYSLHQVSARRARVADKLVTRKFEKSNARGFAAVGEHGAKLVIHGSAPEMAVCLLPGTELAFDDDVRYDRAFSFLGTARVNHKVASFRQVDLDSPHVQHDAVEFPDGQILKLTQLAAGQTATVLQLPVGADHLDHIETRHSACEFDSRLVLDRVSARPGMASVLVPNQGAVMLWHTFRSTALRVSTEVAHSLRRLTTPKERPALSAALPAGFDVEAMTAGFRKSVPAVTLPKKPAASKSERKRAVKSAA